MPTLKLGNLPELDFSGEKFGSLPELDFGEKEEKEEKGLFSKFGVPELKFGEPTEKLNIPASNQIPDIEGEIAIPVETPGQVAKQNEVTPLMKSIADPFGEFEDELGKIKQRTPEEQLIVPPTGEELNIENKSLTQQNEEITDIAEKLQFKDNDLRGMRLALEKEKPENKEQLEGYNARVGMYKQLANDFTTSVKEYNKRLKVIGKQSEDFNAKVKEHNDFLALPGPEESVRKKLQGVKEVVANVVAGAVTFIPVGLVKYGTIGAYRLADYLGLYPESERVSDEVIEDYKKFIDDNVPSLGGALTAKTQLGQKALEKIAVPFEKLHDFAKNKARFIDGEKYPNLKEFATFGVEVFMFGLVGKGARDVKAKIKEHTKMYEIIVETIERDIPPEMMQSELIRKGVDKGIAAEIAIAMKERPVTAIISEKVKIQKDKPVIAALKERLGMEPGEQVQVGKKFDRKVDLKVKKLPELDFKKPVKKEVKAEVKTEVKEVKSDLSGEAFDIAEKAADVKRAKVVPTKDLKPEQKTFIEKRVQKLGSLEKVKKEYKNDDPVSIFARETAAKVFGGDADIKGLKPTIKTTPLSTGFEVQGRGMDKAGKLVGFKHKWQATRDMKVAARKSGADPVEYDVVEGDSGWTFQRREIKVEKKVKIPSKLYRGYAKGKEFRGEGSPIFFSVNKKSATGFANASKHLGEPVVGEYSVDIKNPKVYSGPLEKGRSTFATGSKQVKELKKEGYDSAVYVENGVVKEVITFNKNQVIKKEKVFSLQTLGKPGYKKGKIVPWKMESFAIKAAEKAGENWEVKKLGEKSFVIEKSGERSKIDQKSENIIDEAKRVPTEPPLDYKPIGIYNKNSGMIFKPSVEEIGSFTNPLTLHFDGTHSELVNAVDFKLALDDTAGMKKALIDLGYDSIQFVKIKYGKVYYNGDKISIKKPGLKVEKPSRTVTTKEIEEVLQFVPEVPESVVEIDPKTQTPYQQLKFLGKKYKIGTSRSYYMLNTWVDRLTEAGATTEEIARVTAWKDTVNRSRDKWKKLNDDALAKFNKKKEKKVEKIIKSSKDLYGTGKIAASINPTLQKKQALKDILGVNPTRTIVGELLQNSFDAMRDYTTKPLEVYINDGILAMTDYGKGMSPQIATSDLVTLFEQGTKGAEDMGGFGQAKLAFMGWPDSFDIVTVGIDPTTGKKVQSKIWGTSEDYMLKNNVNKEIKEVADNSKTGTRIILKKGQNSIGEYGIQPHRVLAELETFGEGLRTGQTVKVMKDFKSDKELKETGLTPSIDVKVVDVKSPKWENIDSIFDVEKFSVEGSDVEIKFPKTEPYGWSGEEMKDVRVKVFNKGLLLPDVPKRSSLNFSIAKKPNFEIEINFIKTPEASDIANYPFVVNRTTLTAKVESKVKSAIRKTLSELNEKIADTTKKDIQRLFNSAPKISDTKFIIPITGSTVEAVKVLKQYPKMFSELGEITKLHSDTIGKQTNVPQQNVAITTYAGVHGFRPKSGILKEDYVVVNPFTYLDTFLKDVDGLPYGTKTINELTPTQIKAKDKELESAAIGLISTLTHEYAHTNANGHYLSFVQEFHRIERDLGFSKHKMEAQAYEFFKKYESDIRHATKALEDIQKAGTISPIFSEYVPEQRRVGQFSDEKKSTTDVERHGQVRDRGGVKLTSGFDPVEAVKAIRDLGKDIKAAIPHLETLGKHYYTGEKQRYFDWQKKMKGALGDLWTKVKKYIGEVWKGLKRPLKNEKGAVTIPVREIKAATKRNIKRTKKLLDEKLGALTTRLEKISPSIKNKIIEFELDTGVKVEKIAKDVMLPFIEKTTKMSKKDYDTFDLARKERNKKEIDDLVEKYGMEEEYKKVRGMLDAIGNEARAVGYKFNYLKDYHPRQIIDFEGLMDYLYETGNRSTIEFFIEAKEKKLGRKLTNEEEIKLVNSLFRGYADERITLSKPGQLKLRKLKKIGPEIMEFYGDSNSALLRYVNDIVLAVEAKKLFGDYKIEGLDLNETIGAYILRVSKEKRLTPSQELELRSMLHARFNPVGTSGIVTTFKNVAVIDVMGSPASALRQVGDIGWSMIENGTFASSKAFGKAMVGNFISQKYGSEFTKEDLGISKIGAEFSDKTLSAKAVDSVFRVIWLTKIDAIGKEVLINAAYDIAVRKAKSKDIKVRDAFINKLIPIFENRTDALMEDFRSGVKSRDVKLYLLRKLSEYQPATLSELPQGFIEGGNARIAYMLKSFDLKKFDVYRRKVFQQIAKPGTRIQGIKNLFKIAFFLTLMEATGDTLIDLFLGKPINISDTVVGRISGLAISRYTTSKIRREGPGALLEQILPPTQFINSIFRDVVSAGDGKGLEFTKSIPLVGKFYYYRWGKGLERVEKDREKNQSKNAISRIRKIQKPKGKNAIRKIQRKKRKISR